MNLNELSKDELEMLQVAKENEYRLALDALETVELQDLGIAKHIAELRLSQKNLGTAITQGKYSVRRISSELRSIKPLIYRKLRGE
jgi:hypothetical protein